MNKKHNPNLLDFIPSHNPDFRFETDSEGKVTIFSENKGVYNFIAQKLFKKPRYTQIHLEEYGNFIWPLIDGKKTVMELGNDVKAHFGEKAEPLYQRLSKYIITLKEYGFITYVK